jgi:hypothetical protein
MITRYGAAAVTYSDEKSGTRDRIGLQMGENFPNQTIHLPIVTIL